MPKIIQNVRNQLLFEAKRQIDEFGYEKTTIRSVASACGVGVGTVYNYFPSKDALIASFLLADWQTALSNMKLRACDDAKTTLKAVYDELNAFVNLHAVLFSDKEATKSYSLSLPERHGLLRSQIAKIIQPTCERSTLTNKPFLAEFISESILVWTLAKKDFDDIYKIIETLLT